MNVLIIGSGGREHAIAWKIAQSPLLNELYTFPGNPGTALHGTNLTGMPEDFDRIAEIVTNQEIDIVFVGPEAPLVSGIYDHFEGSAVRIIGPSQEGAQLEGSKAYAKQFMKDYDIPTAGYIEVSSDNIEEGYTFMESLSAPYVLKADGLAGGKGVLIIDDLEEAKHELNDMLCGKFGASSEKVVIEEFLDGLEFSVFVLTDGKRYKVLPVAKDYKRIGEGDTGLNTGGMGAISPVSFVDDAMMKKVEERIILPTIQGIQAREMAYTGIIFLGLIEVNGEPKVIEYNCRMGDPETEVVMPRLETDFLELLDALGTDAFDDIALKFHHDTVATVMLVSGGYPEAYQKGKVMTGTELCENSILFHAGTKMEDNTLKTNGGRVMAITSYGSSKDEAVKQSLANAEKIDFEGKYYRKDIGFDLA